MKQEPVFDAEQVEVELNRVLDGLQRKKQDIDSTLDFPSWVCWTVVVDSLKMFIELKGRDPVRICLPRSVEVLLDAYAAKHLGSTTGIRQRGLLLGYLVRLNHDSFRFE